MIIKTDLAEIQNYLVDASNFKGGCTELYFPESKEDVKEIFKTANYHNLKITITGNRTGLTGGAVPEEGLLISTDKMNKVIEINETDKYAIVEPGVLLRDFVFLVNEKNLYYPPDPTEKDCYIGGNVANNASGAKSFKYGPTRNFVLALNIILPDGEELYLERGKVFAKGYDLTLVTESGKKIDIQLPEYKMPKTKNAAGYFVDEDMDAIDLFIGAEGTLGFISEIKLRLLEKPNNILSSVIFFENENDALKFIEQARLKSLANRSEGIYGEIDALGLEYFDYNSLKFLHDDFPNIPGEAKAAVWFEQELISEYEELIFNKWIELIESCNGNTETAWFANNEKDRKTFNEFRHAVSWKVNEYIVQHNILKLGTDTAVPSDSFKEFYLYSKNLVEKENIHQIAYGHFGDSHLHLNMLPTNDEEFKIAKSLYKKICSKAIELDGTISAEHGIGKIKREYLLMMYGETAIQQMAYLKKQLDPNLVLNIGNIIDPQFYETI